MTVFAVALQAQERLTLDDAIGRTVERNPAVAAAYAAERVAAAGMQQARAGWLPRVDYVEAWQRSNQPVFVFGSLLAQSRFGASNFALEALNHPDAVTNVRAALTIEQPLADFAQPARMRIANAVREGAALGTLALKRDLALDTTRVYGQVLVAATARQAAQSALDAAEEDRLRAQHRRDVGLATDADLLAVQVHAAGMKARLAEATADEAVARAGLNELLGTPFDTRFILEDVNAPASGAAPDVNALEKEALGRRELARQAVLQVRSAEAQRDVARSAFLPRAGLQAGYEFDGKSWSGRERWWMAGVEVRWNLFNGFADRARLAGAEASIAQAQANRERTEHAIRAEVRSAAARVAAAVAREEAGRTALAQAREAQRIIRERYEAGMAGVTDVLRAANALYEAELLHRAATVDVLITRKTLESVAGR